jgi:serine/threonine-protein kinase
VYLAQHTALSTTVAVKVLRPDLGADDRHRRRFLREARAASRIKSDRVVRITDFGVTGDGIVYFVMDYIEGHNLEAVLRREGRLPWPQAKPILVQIAQAIAAAHAEGVIHRDIKPSNCMVCDDGAVNVLDFGLARVLHSEESGDMDLTATGDLFGTVAYMAPELTQRKQADERTDLYALGVLAFRTLTGALPFEGETAFQVLWHHVSTIPPSLCQAEPSLPFEVEACVLRALAKDPAARYQSVGELIEALQRIPEQGGAALPVSAPPLDDSVPEIPGHEAMQATQRVDDVLGVSVEPQARPGPSLGRVAAIGIAAVAMLTALAWWAWPSSDDASADGAERASIASAVEQPSVAQEPPDAPPVAMPSQARVPVLEPEPEPVLEPEPEPEPELPPAIPPPSSADETPTPDEDAQPPPPPRRRAPPDGIKPRPAPPPDDVVGARLAKKALARCGIEGETLHVTCALGSDGRVLSVSIEGGSSEARACVRTMAKRTKYAPGRARIVEIDVRPRGSRRPR